MAAVATFLLGIGSGAELLLHSGEELACSGSSQGVSGRVVEWSDEMKQEKRGHAGFIVPGWCSVS
jgi:hypothetical protein